MTEEPFPDAMAEKGLEGIGMTLFPAAAFDSGLANSTLFSVLVDSAAKFGGKRVAAEDHERQPMTYGRLITASLVLGQKLSEMTERGERVAVMLPNTLAFLSVLFGLNAYGRIAALLNYTAGIRNIEIACEIANLKRIITSRRFVEQGELDDIVAALQSAGREVVYLEDIRDSITLFDKLMGAVAARLARRVIREQGVKPQDDAVVLFTSGSEGTPKGVVLTNANITANIAQVRGHVRAIVRDSDVIFNPLPLFHSFGLVAGALLWLSSGHRFVLYPTPLHFRQIPRLIAATGSTLLISTDTFSRNYARAAEGDDLAGVRLIVSGAEAVKPESRALWEKYGTVILEGYGVTETAPILAVNLPEAFKFGTVGRMIPGVEAKLEPVEGLHEGGRLFVRGPNIMRGYLDPSSKTGVVEPLDGWHDTGDIVTIDSDGYITIRGRAKRFAKLGGEMVSLAAVEAVVQKLWPDDSHVVVALPDPRKGEQLILVTSRETADKDELLAFGKREGFPELWIPRALLVASIPVLGSGKVDYGATVEMVRKLRAML